MRTKDSKDVAEKLIEMYIKEYITKTQYFDMMKRIKASSK